TTRVSPIKVFCIVLIAMVLVAASSKSPLKSIHKPPTSGFSQGERLQYHNAGFRLTTCPSMKRRALRPSWRGIGPPQLGSSPVTPPVLGASLPGSWRIQHPGFSGEESVTHLSGSWEFSGLLPPSVIYATQEGLRTPPRAPGHCAYGQGAKSQPPGR